MRRVFPVQLCILQTDSLLLCSERSDSRHPSSRSTAQLLRPPPAILKAGAHPARHLHTCTAALIKVCSHPQAVPGAWRPWCTATFQSNGGGEKEHSHLRPENSMQLYQRDPSSKDILDETTKVLSELSASHLAATSCCKLAIALMLLGLTGSPHPLESTLHPSPTQPQWHLEPCAASL